MKLLHLFFIPVIQLSLALLVALLCGDKTFSTVLRDYIFNSMPGHLILFYNVCLLICTSLETELSSFNLTPIPYISYAPNICRTGRGEEHKKEIASAIFYQSFFVFYFI